VICPGLTPAARAKAAFSPFLHVAIVNLLRIVLPWREIQECIVAVKDFVLGGYK
jgi:hypothetical protein